MNEFLNLQQCTLFRFDENNVCVISQGISINVCSDFTCLQGVKVSSPATGLLIQFPPHNRAHTPTYQLSELRSTNIKIFIFHPELFSQLSRASWPLGFQLTKIITTLRTDRRKYGRIWKEIWRGEEGKEIYLHS